MQGRRLDELRHISIKPLWAFIISSYFLLMAIEIKHEQLKEIAEYLDAGMACFYNKTTGELETFPYGLENSGLEEEWAE